MPVRTKVCAQNEPLVVDVCVVLCARLKTEAIACSSRATIKPIVVVECVFLTYAQAHASRICPSRSQHRDFPHEMEEEVETNGQTEDGSFEYHINMYLSRKTIDRFGTV